MRWLIVSACMVTVAVTYLGMQSLWDIAAFATHRSSLLYGSALALGVAAALACAYLPRFDVSRLVRVAVVLPIVHLIAMAIALKLWAVLHDDMRYALREWDVDMHMRGFAVPSFTYALLAFPLVPAIAIAIKRRHGEWAHAAVMLALAYLLLLGLWLPFASSLSVENLANDYRHHFWEEAKPQITVMGIKLWGHEISRRVLSPTTYLALAVLPPALIATAFTAFAFRRPRAFARTRRALAIALKIAVPLSVLTALSMTDGEWRLYLESSYLLFTALVLAIGALATLTTATWLRSHHLHRRLRAMPTQVAKIADDEDEPIARLEITSWLRGPHLSVRSFVLDTPQGDVPVHGATLVTPVPASTTSLGIGAHTGVLAAGDHVVVAGRSISTDGPFRAGDAQDIAMIAAPGARRYRFSDVSLVVWRPAVAYLAIMIAVALPYLSVLVT